MKLTTFLGFFIFMQIDYLKLSELSIADLCAIKDLASMHLSMATAKKDNEKDVAHWFTIATACLSELNKKLEVIFKYEENE